MRILVVSYSSLKMRGGWYYGMGQKLINGFTRLGHAVEFFSDRDIVRANSPFGWRSLGIKKANKLFIDYIERFKPDLVVLCHSDLIRSDSLYEAKAKIRNIRIAEVRVDAMHNTQTIPLLTSRNGYVDHIFLTTGGRVLDLVGSNRSPACFIPNPGDYAIEDFTSHKHNDQLYDAIYSKRPGVYNTRGDYRIQIIEEISRNPSIKIYTIGQKDNGLFGRSYFETIGNSRIGLNLSYEAKEGKLNYSPSEMMYNYSSDRIAHYGGCGLALIIPKMFQFQYIMDKDREYLEVSSPEDARDKVEWLISNPKERMLLGRAAYDAFHGRFSIEKVCNYIIEKTFRIARTPVEWDETDFIGRSTL